jgi:16S rRNA (cytosine1402-N4)-methyltransferase
MTTPERSRSLASEAEHEPVLAAEVVSFLAPRPDGVYVDATIGLGGHTAALLDAGAGRVIGIDRDAEALVRARSRLEGHGDRVAFVHADYRDVAEVLAGLRQASVNGVLADFGVSSLQLDDAGRGFSFRQEGPLDMRMDPSRGAALKDRLAGVEEDALATVISTYGEERQARRVARAIVRAQAHGALTSTTELAVVIRRAVGSRTWQRIDPATRTFQALRIWVNDELAGVEAFLPAAVAALVPGGRLATIAFHSLEDRAVKHTFRRWAAEGAVTLVTRRPVVPGEAEQARNARSRSAKLRVVEKVA